jgi:hypothetical protein
MTYWKARYRGSSSQSAGRHNHLPGGPRRETGAGFFVASSAVIGLDIRRGTMQPAAVI